MRRQLLGLVFGLGLTASQGWAQTFENLPMYEDQLAGVHLGWQGRTITGLWNFDRVPQPVRSRLRTLYRMPDHIVMRVGTRIPLYTGAGAGADGSYDFFLGTYGRGNAAGGSSGGGAAGEGGGSGSSEGAPAMAQGLDHPVARERVQEFIAQAQAAEPAIPPGASGAPPMGGFESEATRQFQQNQALSEIPPDAAEQKFNEVMEQARQLDRRVFELDERRRQLEIEGQGTWAEQMRLAQEAARFLQRALDLRTQAVELAASSATLRQRQNAQAYLSNFRLFYHVFHVGQPQRDIVFCYKMGLDTWLSVTINFFTWQVDGITVANTRSTWDGARTSAAPDGSRGIALGDSLQQVFNRYGWPDGWESFYGRYLLIHYYDTNNVGFLLDHPQPKVWRVVRMIIEPRPNGQERQLGGVQLGLNAQQLLTIRRSNGRLVYGEPHAIELPNHRISQITRPPAPDNWPPGVPLDATLFGAGMGNLFGGVANTLGSGGGGEPGAEGDLSGPSAPNLRPSIGPGYDVGAPVIATPAMGVVAERPGVRSNTAADRDGRPTAQAQAPAGEGLPGEAGIMGESGGVTQTQTAANVLCRYPMPFYYARDAMNVEAVCADGAGGGAAAAAGGGAPTEGGSAAAPAEGGGTSEPGSGGAGGGGGGGAGSLSRESLVGALNLIYGDLTGQAGFNIVYGFRSNPGTCHIDTAIPETQFRWDYSFLQRGRVLGGRMVTGDTKVEFGLDSDGLTTQIGVMGAPWGGARTKRGIGLGSPLRDVLLRYGPPLLYNEFIGDVAEQQPNLSFVSYSRDELGRPMGNLSLVLQDKKVTAMQVVQLSYR